MVKGEPLSVAARIFFAKRSHRRAFEIRKFGASLLAMENDRRNGNRRKTSSSVFTKRSRLNGSEAAMACIDLDWYASLHGLKMPELSYDHFSQIGLARSYAPCPDFAGEDGIHLARWGVECLFRAQVSLGDTGKTPLRPDDPQALNPFKLNNPGGKRVAVVSAIFGGFDRLLPLDPAWDKDTDFFLFSDRVFDAPSLWQQVHANFDHPDPRLRARFVKTHLPTYLSAYDWVVWVDGNVLICTDPAEIVQAPELDAVDFASFRHPDRVNLMSEAAACISFSKEDPAVVARHLSQNFGRAGLRVPLLFETMVCALRPQVPQVRQMCALWWEAIMKGSKRDQLSLPLAVTETPSLSYGFLPGNIHMTPHFAKNEHLS